MLFMSYIAFFVYKAMGNDVGLVSKNYYEQEIAYQDHMDKVARTQALGEVRVNYQEAPQSILVQLPETLQGQRISGSISLFRPSDDSQDQEIALQLGRDLSQLVAADSLQQGVWKVRVNFLADEVTYYAEQIVRVK